MAAIIQNKEFTEAFKFVTQTNQSIFLTGKAGTGKTTFLKYLKANCVKNTVVAAPTGVAAINAGGITLHSLFQLPFAPFIPHSKGWNSSDAVQDKNSLLAKLRYNKERLKILTNLELLVIDEISMVRADVLDAIDTILKHVRKQHHLPFGGVQILFIGDLYQLPPVIKEDEKNILQPYYASEFFFDSEVVKSCKPVCIELTHIYRQNEQTFINLLNKVRTNEIAASDLALLNTRFLQKIDAKIEYITLTSHNYQANEINTHSLQALPTKAYFYKASITGEFSAYSYPTDENLELKVGAQIMFTKNDVGNARKYFNGKIGKITSLSEDKIMVKCDTDTEEIEVRKDVWKNIKYTVNKENNKLEEDEVGSFTQFPLRLAWAITIHKSQGLTFTHTAIDAAKSFSSGQLYVAISRCTSLEGIILLSKIPAHALQVNNHVVNYFLQNKPNSNTIFVQSQQQYVQELLLQLYNFTLAQTWAKELLTISNENKSYFLQNSKSWVDNFFVEIEKLHIVALKFEKQLSTIIAQESNVANNTALHTRMQQANVYFAKACQDIVQLIVKHTVSIESKQIATTVDDLLNNLYNTIYTKCFLFERLQQTFTVELFFENKNNLHIPTFEARTYAAKQSASGAPTESHHPILYNQLSTLRNDICTRTGKAIYMVANKATLVELSNYLPNSLQELAQITGFGKAKVKIYGVEFLYLIAAYAEQNNLQSNMQHHPKMLKNQVLEKKEKIKLVVAKEGVSTTILETFNLYNDGNNAEQIAEQRKLTLGTIHGHFAKLIDKGKIAITDVLPKETIANIKTILHANEGKFLAEIIAAHPTLSYGECKMVQAHLQREKES